MKKFLLMLCSFFAVLSMAAGSYMIEFKTGNSKSGSEIKTSTQISDFILKGADLVSAVKSSSKVYYNVDGGIRFGSSGAVGSIELSLSDDAKVCPTKIVAYAKLYDNNATLKINGVSQKLTSKSQNSDFQTLTFNFDGQTSISSIKIENTAKNNRVCLLFIEVSYEGGAEEKTRTELKWGEESVIAVDVKEFTSPSLTCTPEEARSLVRYASSNTEVATIDAETGDVTLVAPGTTEISASIAENDTYKASTAKYTLTVTQDNSSVGANKTATVTFSDLWKSNTMLSNVVVDSNITLYFDQGTNAQNAPQYYINGIAARLYAGNTLCVKGSAKQIEITKVEFTSDNTSKKQDEKFNADNASASVGEFSSTTWSGKANEITFTQNSKGRIQSITVTYTVRPAIPSINDFTEAGSPIEKDEDGLIRLNVAEGHNLYVKVIERAAANAPRRAAALTAADVDLKDGTWERLNTNGETEVMYKVPENAEALHFVAEQNGVISEPHSVAFANDGSMTGVEAVEAAAEAVEAEWYNLQGVRVVAPVKGGLYIRRAAGVAEKVIF